MSGAWITGPNSFIGPRPQGYFTFRTLLGQIVTSGTTPHLYLIKKYAWILICMVVLPPVLHDIYDYLTPLTPAQQLDLDRSQRRLLYKLRHAIGGWKIHTIDPSETGRSAGAIRKFLEAFREDFAANWEGDGRVRIEKSGLQTKRVKSKHIEESLKEVLGFDRRSDDVVAGALVLADALQEEARVVYEKTVEQRDMKYADGQQLHETLARCEWCISILAGFRGSYSRPRSRIHRDRRATMGLAIAAVRARYNEASQVRRKMAAEDRWKMFKLIMLGKRHMPFIIAQVFFNIASGSIQTMFRWQNAEVINFFTDRQADGTVNLDGFGNILYGIIMTRMLGIAITKTSNHLEKHGLLKMSVALKRAVYGKMMEQDMTCFEEKFKRKDQARVMLNYYLAQKVMSRVSRVVQRVRDISRISSAFFMLRQRSPQLLLINFAVLPLRIIYGEITNSLETNIEQRMMDTTQFDVAALLSTLDSRSSFAATRLTGMEKVQMEKFSTVMGRFERLQMQSRTLRQIRQPVLNMLRTFGEMVGYFFGAAEVVNGTLTPADMMTFVNEAQSLTLTIRGFWDSFSYMYQDRRDALFVARFAAVEPTIGLSGSRPDGFKYIIPKSPASEFIWTFECKDVTFWYPSDPEQKKVFSGLNMTISHGKTVGICGQTGCGKSTLLRLLTRLYDVQGGTILLNGRDVRDFEPQWLRENIAFVTSVKDTYLFSTTVSTPCLHTVGTNCGPHALRAATLPVGQLPRRS